MATQNASWEEYVAAKNAYSEAVGVCKSVNTRKMRHELDELSNSLKLADLESRVERQNSNLVDLEKQKRNLPKNIFGMVKDRKKLERLNDSIIKAHENLNSLPQSAEHYRLRAEEQWCKLGIPGMELSAVAIKDYLTKLDLETATLAERLEQNYTMMKRLAARAYGFEEATLIMSKGVFGPSEAFTSMGVDITPEEMPKLPPTEIMQKSNELGGVLALRIYKGFELNFPDRISRERCDGDKDRAAEWVLFIPDENNPAYNLDYVSQTKALGKYLDSNGLLSPDLREDYSEERLDPMRKTIAYSHETARELLALKLNQRHRHSAPDIIYFNRLMRTMKFNKSAKDTQDIRSLKSYFGECFEAVNDQLIEDQRRSTIYAIGGFPDSRSFDGMTSELPLTERKVNFNSYPSTARVVLYRTYIQD